MQVDRAAGTEEQLRVLRSAPRLAEADVAALQSWLREGSSETVMDAMDFLLCLAVKAGFGVQHTINPDAPPGATAADAAPALAVLRGAPGLVEAVLPRLLEWGRGQEEGDYSLKLAFEVAQWLQLLPKMQTAAAAAAPLPAATAAAAAAAAAAVGADQTVVRALTAAAAVPPPAAAGERAVMQQPGPSAGSSGSGAGAAALLHVCGVCGKSAAEAPLLRCVGCKAQYYCGNACALAHWPSHRAACKAARSAMAAQRS